MSPFRAGIQRIVERTPVPVVPIALRGLWGSFFSRSGGRAMSRPASVVPFRPIALAVGPAVPAADAKPEKLQEIVRELRGEWR
jgi:1-acyl-sn-glycerol-3-phosphate acyltransferase